MSESFRERLSTLSRGEIAGCIIFVSLVLAGAVFWYLRALPQPVSIQAGPASPMLTVAAVPGFGPSAVPGMAVSPASPSMSASPSVGVVVHVAGWVQHPGVFELDAGSRAIDALDRAGGPRKGAQLDALNLAALLQDGQQLLVPGPTGAKGVADAAVISGAPAPGSTTKINVNTADALALQELPGVGEVIAQRIVDYRDENGAFTKPEDLMDVSGIGDVTFSEMVDQVTV